MQKAQDQMLLDLINSFLVAFGFIAGMMIILMLGLAYQDLRTSESFATTGIILVRSVFAGLLAMIPNILPCIAVLGSMGLAGMTIEIGSMMTASVALGIAVDDTLHLLVEYRRGLARFVGDKQAALRHALTHVGRAISCTTLAVCAGLLVVGAGALQNQAEFGMLGAATLAIAWLVDVTVTPALCLKLIDEA